MLFTYVPYLYIHLLFPSLFGVCLFVCLFLFLTYIYMPWVKCHLLQCNLLTNDEALIKLSQLDLNIPTAYSINSIYLWHWYPFGSINLL